MSNSWYDMVQICLNGHIINRSTIAYPMHNQKYCDKCGAPTITNCQSCGTEIKGSYHVQGVFGIDDSPSPGFCHNCGNSYPWTEAKIKAAQELILELDNLTQEEKQNLNESLNDIIRDTPETTVAATRIKKLFTKAGKGVAERNMSMEIRHF